MVSTCRKETRNKKNSFHRVKKYFLNKLFSLISLKVSTCRKKKKNKRKRFPQHKTENPSSPCGVKNSFKNTFPLYGKTASSGQKIANSLHSQENIFLLKLVSHNYNHGFQQQKKTY